MDKLSNLEEDLKATHFLLSWIVQQICLLSPNPQNKLEEFSKIMDEEALQCMKNLELVGIGASIGALSNKVLYIISDDIILKVK